MTILNTKYQRLTFLSGILFLIIYFSQDFLYEKVWVFYLLLLLVSGLAFTVVFLIGLRKKRDKGVIPILLVLLFIVAITETLKSEIFKSKKVFTAVLKDDRSYILLTLRKNKSYEINTVTMFSEEKFKGKYKVANDKIIFLGKPYSSNFIPDTVTVLNDKIILRFNNNGEPVLDYAAYFDIQQNHLTNGL